MVDIRPFRGLRYAPDKVNLGLALAPPYDVIDVTTQQALYARSPYNVIRLEYPRTEAEIGSAQRQDVLTLGAWLEDGVLRRDVSTSLYIHEQRFSVMDEEKTRLGLIAAVRLHRLEERVILPHEQTTPSPVEDRLSALRAMRTNVSPVFGLFRDPESQIRTLMRAATGGPPISEAALEGEEHRLWPITAPELQQALQHLFGDKAIYLADGHHRFQAASAFRDERQRSGEGDDEQAWQFVLMHLVALEDAGLVVLPLHRLIRGLTTDEVANLDSVLDAFDTKPLVLPQDEQAAALAIVDALAAGDARGPTFCLYRQGGEAKLLTPRAERGHEDARSRPTLDVVLLHRLLVDRLVGSPKVATDRGDLAYTPWALEALQRVRAGQYQMAIFQNPVPVTRIAELAEQGEQMPPKSTYFYPKLPTGLVLKRADDGPL